MNIKLHKNITQPSAGQAPTDYQLYNLLFAGKISLKEYLNSLSEGKHQSKKNG